MPNNIAVEFTIEPFVDGEPPRYVMAAVEAVAALGLHVEVGPFGSLFVVPVDEAGAAVSAAVDAAYAHGATHVSISTEMTETADDD